MEERSSHFHKHLAVSVALYQGQPILTKEYLLMIIDSCYNPREKGLFLLGINSTFRACLIRSNCRYEVLDTTTPKLISMD
ncbi:hypothetical protein SCLCIDRAFT_652282 [Scleroderma citrinum Foug A]|uniref:Uncharacterized protein n=1 Tax=Scleroderma citrinum Foug A TaxID=1036808 RepID=A0A0C2ZEI7_9AGAM|nr:hypothetical protein SCLCIDRAFT_652282 [Scleroderma citrinum Foug A]